MNGYRRVAVLLTMSLGISTAGSAQSPTASTSRAHVPSVDAAGSTALQPVPSFTLEAANRSHCAAGQGDDIVVCKKSDERYRLPAKPGFDPNGPVDSVLRERSRLLEGGESGTHSCNFVVGAGSWTGCELKAMERARQQGRSVSRFGDIHLGRR